ncbi:alpha/beta fold hydrolase [Microbacterium kyungheense]|uniref:Alpha-beta hydrolase superfamily lysophospholipase n=1 Tax=Microbacterium kyungheense TaxID=1263636 RepID=A0A543EUN5_9MICO|nr:alpha/beta fold hydrolase [Microbacterium kyungheense]TQM25283.1 alpha-beta hydrolase superfamily lysophospholipase [Microbacterium kyungheense]
MPEFIDAHGVTIVYDVHAATEPRAVLQLIHGVGEHAGRYAALIEALTARGITVYAADLRGHGRTGMKQHGGDVSKLGKLGPGGVRATLAAMWQLSELIRAEAPDLPLVLFGHSGGSFLAQMLVNDHPDGFDGLVLSGSAYRMPGSLRTGGHNDPWKSPTATGLEWLSTDPAVGAAFRDDPLTTEESPMALFGPIEVLRIFGRPRKRVGRGIPTLLMVGRDDTVGGPRSVHRLADAYRTRSRFTDVTTLVYPGARHEIFNEVMQADVRADLLAWLDQRFPARG